MKLWSSLIDKFGGITRAVSRFPGTFLFLITIAVLNSLSIENRQDYSKLIFTFVFGTFCLIVAQILVERFWEKSRRMRAFSMLAAGILTVACYLLLLLVPRINIVVGIRITVAIFALLIAFIWIPSIRRNTDFNNTFMCFFKSIFTSAFFSAIIWGGISLIIVAIDRLLIPVNSNVYMHAANSIWVIWAPMFFLSMIPIFNDRDEDWENVQRASHCPKFLEVLLSYVLIPLAAVYTVVLLLYMVKTILNQNWTDNLLEPLILSYLVAVILLYILTSGLNNRFVTLFRLVFPKLILPVALFQIVSSSITVYTDGLVYSRYFVLLFSLYSVICGVWLSIKPVKKNGFVAALAIAFALISILPPIDAFTVSRASQLSLLQGALEKNEMLNGNAILPNANLLEKDKSIIVNAVLYFNEVDETEKIPFLPEDFHVYSDFKNTFGFPLYGNKYTNDNQSRSQYYMINPQYAIEIDGYDYICSTTFNVSDRLKDNELCNVSKDGKSYHVTISTVDDNATIGVLGADNSELVSASLRPMIESIDENGGFTEKGYISEKEMVFEVLNNPANLKIVFQNANILYSGTEMTFSATITILFSIT